MTIGTLHFLTPQSADYVQQHRKHDTQNDRRGEREIESRSFSPIKDVSGQTSQGQAGAPQDQEEQSEYKQNEAEED